MRLILIFCSLLISFCGNTQNQIAVYFDSNQFELNSVAKAKLDSLFTSSKDIEITKIQGFCDNLDSNQHNYLLSISRAKTIENFAKNQKIYFSKAFEIKGFGEQFKQEQLTHKNRKAILYFTRKIVLPSGKSRPVEFSSFETNENSDFDIEETKNKLLDNIKKAKKGEIIIFENLNFYINSEKLIPKSQPLVTHLLQILNENPQIVVEIRGHICCNPNPNNITLSSRRAKFLFDFLIKNGIKTGRLAYKGFGSSSPIHQLPEKNAYEEQSNRRIELVIISNNYKF